MHIREIGLHKEEVVRWCLNVCVTVVTRNGADSHQKNNNIIMWQYSCVLSYAFNCASVTEHFCNQFRDFSSLYGPVYTSLLIFTKHFHSDAFFLQFRKITVKFKHMMQLHVISPMSLQHNTSYTMFNWTFLEVSLNVTLTFVQSITQTTGKRFVFWMYWMMMSQFSCCIETLWTFTANLRLHSFMSLNVYLEVTIAAEFLLTNVTRKPSTFIVWLQQMCLELF